MGITRGNLHKRRLTGGKKKIMRKKRKFELGRPAANTKIGPKQIHLVRVRSGNYKFRALHLERGNFSWGSEAITKKTRILRVVYNATSNELVSTNTLVKGCIIQIDATPFKQYTEQFYHLTPVVKASKTTDDKAKTEEKKAATPAKAPSGQLKHKINWRAKHRVADALLDDQFKTGRLLARITSRPGQSGRADGYVLEGEELNFYLRKLREKKGRA